MDLKAFWRHNGPCGAMRAGPPDVMGHDRKLKEFAALPEPSCVLVALYWGVCFLHASPTAVNQTNAKRS